MSIGSPGGARRRRGFRARHASRGQSLVEFVVVVPVLLLLILGVVQMVLLYRVKTTLDFATLETARAGAVHGARMSDMKTGLAQGLTPLFAHGTGVAELGRARARAALEVANPLVSSIEIVSPTRAAWNEHRERQWDGSYALPNDNLAFRSTTAGGSGLNVQDANILKIRVVYHYPLVVPFVDRVLRGQSRLIEPSGPFDRVATRRDPFGDHFRIALESSAIVRMQSPIDAAVARRLP